MESFRKFKNRILTKDFLKTVLNSIDEAISIIIEGRSIRIPHKGECS